MTEEDKEIPSVEDLFEKTKDYVNTRLELLKLKSINKSANILSAVIMVVILSVLGLLVLILISIGFAKGINILLGTGLWGYFIMALIYVITGFTFFVNRKRFLKVPFSNWLIKNLID